METGVDASLWEKTSTYMGKYKVTMGLIRTTTTTGYTDEKSFCDSYSKRSRSSDNISDIRINNVTYELYKTTTANDRYDNYIFDSGTIVSVLLKSLGQSTIFKNCIFPSDIDISILDGHKTPCVIFDNCTFGGKLYVSVDTDGMVQFNKSHFIDSVTLEQCKFISNQLSFSKCTFDARFEILNFKSNQGLPFSDSVFWGTAHFNEIDSDVSIFECRFESSLTLVLTKCMNFQFQRSYVQKLSHLKFKQIESLENIDLADLRIGMLGTIADFNFFTESKFKQFKSNKIQSLYSLSFAAKMSGQTDIELRILYQMKLDNSKHISNPCVKAGDQFSRLTTKYFTSYGRLLFTISAVIVVSSVFYFIGFTGLSISNQISNESSVTIINGNSKIAHTNIQTKMIDSKPVYNIWEKAGYSLYFSIITFATVGYGDITPATAWMRLVASIESLAGVLSVGALITIYARRHLN